MHFDPWETLYAGDVGAAFTATLRCIRNERTVFYVLGKRLCLATPFESQLYSGVLVTATRLVGVIASLGPQLDSMRINQIITEA